MLRRGNFYCALSYLLRRLPSAAELDRPKSPDECILVTGTGAVGCATAEGMVRDVTGRPMSAVYMYFGGSLTPGRVGSGFGENREDNHITDQAGHYRMRTVLLRHAPGGPIQRLSGSWQNGSTHCPPG